MERPSASDQPTPHPWATRRLRGAGISGHLWHPWATRRPRGSDALEERPEPSVAATTSTTASEHGAETSTEGPGEFEPNSGSGRSARSRPSVRRLGDGLLAMPQVSPMDPLSAVLESPEVPESKRLCWRCQQPVGRGSETEPGPVSGTCASCGSPFNFRPTLPRGEMVAGQYEVQGCLAYGGLGWIYLAVDRNVSDRWVVLKGLQNPLDFEAHIVALAERQFLSEVAYPSIVKIYNFVKHRSAGDVLDGYIVMEYVGGRSLKKMLDMRAPERFSVAEAIAFMMEILPALDYLHSFGLAYNDLKPDNIMVSEDEVKLIDLGAVAAIGSYGSIYGTPGYQAPEITETGPTVASDIYTVGRTLAALIFEFPDDDPGNHRTDIPTPAERRVLRRYPALRRLLVRATQPDPQRRFPSAYSLHCQLAGVLRIVLATDTESEHPQPSLVFGSLRGHFGIETLIGQTDGMTDGRHRLAVLDAANVVAALPVPLIDSQDPSAELLSTLLHGDPRHALDALQRVADRSATETIPTPESFELEGTLTAVRAHLDLGELALASDGLANLRSRYGTDWRVDWYSAIAALLDQRYRQAYDHFDHVHSMVPGELAPILALAATAELILQTVEPPNDAQRWHQLTIEHYRTVWRTNHGVVSAAFGLARRLAADGQPLEAVAILDQVPEASRFHALARLTGCLLLVSRPAADLTEAELCEAAARLDAAPDEPRTLQLRVIVLGAALESLNAPGHRDNPGAAILGFPCTVLGLRSGLDVSLRALARRTPHRFHRYRLIDLANQLRPRTWF